MASSSGSDRWRRLEALFYDALELTSDARSEFLDQHCDGDAQLRKEVEALLASAEKPMDFLEKPVLEAAHQMMERSRHKTIATGTQLAHYEIISMIGAGGMGEVYLAEDTRLRRKVALKMLAPELTYDERGLRRFEHEAHAASALNHPNILTIYEFGQAEGLHFIASEFIDGATLGQILQKGRPELSTAVDVSIQIASALAAAHACGIVHRDIKPDNVIVRTDGIVKVLDFGIAKLSERQVATTIRRRTTIGASSTSEPGMVLGTANYMSPEQARGITVDARSDVFSLGAVIYELVTGRNAFKGETASDVIAEILKVEPVPPVEFVPDVPSEIERMISKALRKDRDSRYQTVKELLIDLQDFKKEAEFQAKLHLAARPGDRSAQEILGTVGIGSAKRRSSSPRVAATEHEPFESDLRASRAKWLVGLAVLLLAVLVVGYFVVRAECGYDQGSTIGNSQHLHW
jgi:serine/threonine protein kinase